MPFLDQMHLENSGVRIHQNTGVVLLPNKNSPLLLLTGEIPRDTSFEKGFPFQYMENDNEKNLTPDPLVKDDQALVANIRNKGLVILTACGHSGVINTINYAKKITGINKDPRSYRRFSSSSRRWDSRARDRTYFKGG